MTLVNALGALNHCHAMTETGCDFGILREGDGPDCGEEGTVSRYCLEA